METERCEHCNAPCQERPFGLVCVETDCFLSVNYQPKVLPNGKLLSPLAEFNAWIASGHYD